jgi:putative tryptophan/tyrosine transport system substrate-binding protein
MRRRDWITLGSSVVIARTFAAFAQTSTQRPLIAVLFAGSSTSAVSLNSLLQGLQEIGYVKGRDIDIVSRYAAGDLTRLPVLAAELQ